MSEEKSNLVECVVTKAGRVHLRKADGTRYCPELGAKVKVTAKQASRWTHALKPTKVAEAEAEALKAADEAKKQPEAPKQPATQPAGTGTGSGAKQ